MLKKNIISDRYQGVTLVKYCKLTMSGTQPRHQNSIKDILNQAALPAIFKLNIDCFYEIFDWLSLKDLISIANTCKRMQRIAGQFFQLNYVTKCARVENDGIYISSIKANVFSRFIQKISISGDRLEAFRYIGSNCSDSIKQIRVYGCIPDGAFEYIKDILKGVEVLEINECIISGECYASFLKYCPNVKSLSVSRSTKFRDSDTVVGTGNDWLLRKYPSIEHFEMTELYELQLIELKTFFEQNSNVQTFSTDAKSLWVNGELFRTANVKLDIFVISIVLSKIVDSNKRLISIKDSIYKLLVELHERGFYQRLHLYVYFAEQKDVDLLLTLNGIEMFNGDKIRVGRPLVNVKASCVCLYDEILNIEGLPNSLLNLERIYLSEVTSDRLLPLIRHSAKLKVIKISQLKDKPFFGKLDLVAMNREREKLFGANKVRIYVREDVFLATKWTKQSVNFSHIELKRFEGYEWIELCARAKYFKEF